MMYGQQLHPQVELRNVVVVIMSVNNEVKVVYVKQNGAYSAEIINSMGCTPVV